MSLSPPNGSAVAGNVLSRITLQTLVRMARAEPFACLTCYDASTAKWLARGGVHVLLVGDTAAEMVLGLNRTIEMPLEVLLALTAGVKRGGSELRRHGRHAVHVVSNRRCDGDPECGAVSD